MVELRGPYPSPIPGVCGRCGGTGLVHGPGQNGNWTDERCDCTWPVGACCDMHNRNCEGPGDLCCWSCTEDDHPWHRDGSVCVLVTAEEPTDG